MTVQIPSCLEDLVSLSVNWGPGQPAHRNSVTVSVGSSACYIGRVTQVGGWGESLFLKWPRLGLLIQDPISRPQSPALSAHPSLPTSQSLRSIHVVMVFNTAHQNHLTIGFNLWFLAAWCTIKSAVLSQYQRKSWRTIKLKIIVLEIMIACCTH